MAETIYLNDLIKSLRKESEKALNLLDYMQKEETSDFDEGQMYGQWMLLENIIKKLEDIKREK